MELQVFLTVPAYSNAWETRPKNPKIFKEQDYGNGIYQLYLKTRSGSPDYPPFMQFALSLANRGIALDLTVKGEDADEDHIDFAVRFDHNGDPIFRRNSAARIKKFVTDMVHCRYDEVHKKRREFIAETQTYDLNATEQEHGQRFQTNLLLEIHKPFKQEQFT